MVYSIKKLSHVDVLRLLQDCENSFTPPLSKNIPYTIDEYAKKLSTNATFVVCEDEGVIIGFTAFYTNKEGGFAFIPQIWVSEMHQRKGIGANLMDLLINEAPIYIKTIRLEVRKSNEKAVRFYNRTGFLLIEEINNKLLLEKTISKS